MFNENIERARMRRSGCHPLLRGTRAGKFTHGFSMAEMETLTSICDTVLPLLLFDSPTTIVAAAEKAFYEASGSQSPISDELYAFNFNINEAQGNSFSGMIPASFGALTSLKRLRLDNNNLSGNVPFTVLQLVEFANLHLLKEILQHHGNALNNFLPAK